VDNTPKPNLLYIQKIATFIFLFFAQILWPMWVPIAILLLEKSNMRKAIQRILVGAGLIVGCYLAYCLLTFSVEAKIIGYHIAYLQRYPQGYRIKNLAVYQDIRDSTLHLI
jgi:flagellar biosynthesis protein FliR